MIPTDRFTVARAIAWYLREDAGDVERGRRYQPTRTPCPVYTNADEYLTATSSAQRAPRASPGWVWRRMADQAEHGAGWTIWIAENDA
jgi:hypothetical protein